MKTLTAAHLRGQGATQTLQEARKPNKRTGAADLMWPGGLILIIFLKCRTRRNAWSCYRLSSLLGFCRIVCSPSQCIGWIAMLLDNASCPSRRLLYIQVKTGGICIKIWPLGQVLATGSLFCFVFFWGGGPTGVRYQQLYQVQHVGRGIRVIR